MALVCFKGNEGIVTTEQKYERLESAKDGDTRAARCEHWPSSDVCCSC